MPCTERYTKRYLQSALRLSRNTTLERMSLPQILRLGTLFWFEKLKNTDTNFSSDGDATPDYGIHFNVGIQGRGFDQSKNGNSAWKTYCVLPCFVGQPRSGLATFAVR